jgi:hypothetical protein
VEVIDMRPTVLIIEARREVAAALEAVIESVNLTPVCVPHLEHLDDLAVVPAVILVRIAFESVSDPPHAAIKRLPPTRPPVIAIAWEEDELAEAQKLKCDVILHAPHDISRLRETLAKLIEMT